MSSAPAATTGPAPVIIMRSASFGYAGRPVVTDVDLTVRAGEVVAVLGPNGSGKTTLVKGLLGLSEHLSGTVEVLGTPVARLHDRARIGYVPQRHTLVGGVRATVGEVVATGLLSRRPWWRPARRADREAVRAAVEAAGLGDRLRFDVESLSGGQQRRVLIARALVARPEVLVMDEPTAGVDRASQDVLARVLRRLAAEGTTMLIVTHELSALRGIVDRIVEVDSSHVTFDGTPERYADHQAELARRSGREVLG
ncbi:metal ABC transporter ATP-binding protein [Ornithinimicrobium humiphilum]|uniref:Zinc transport system ATP-binding protein n=1 Tax=Ornithinimicrobium humiphilum TaxID=125288 RepID=A0A543KPZ9_9MICO|nr:metal ABC transporter ATP-binding protein [Ornithinimicrobium humiphilum]TQM97137.1 zinc transport system ATP-binding protein [Ornithinimicrobium humiphilum]